jgi:hypothetical protein
MQIWFEEQRSVTGYGHRRGCGGIIEQRACFLAVLLRRSGVDFVQKTETMEVRIKFSDTKNIST